MKITQASYQHIREVVKIYELARQRMSAGGNTSQWVNGYPCMDTTAKDIEKNRLFIYTDKAQIVACFTLEEGPDPTYQKIYQGQWLDDAPYAVVHRLAVLTQGGGLGAQCLHWCLKQHSNIRIDTHEQNTPMRRLLSNLDFVYCGIIKTASGDDRLAFQRILSGKP